MSDHPAGRFFRPASGGIDLFVRLTPRGGADALGGVERGADGRVHLAARVRAVPQKGAANAALEALVARALGLARGEVRVCAGATARTKTLRIAGDPVELAARLEALQMGWHSS